MLNPIHLQTLQAVLRTGSFVDAGRQLGYTGSAVSQQIAALEREVDAQLFERRAHTIHPTPIAHYIGAQATPVLSALRALDSEIVAHLEGEIGQLRLGAFSSAGERVLPPALSLFRTLRPDIDVQLVEGSRDDLIEMVRSREIDLALSYEYGVSRRRWPHGLRVDRLLVEDLLLACPVDHQLAAGPDFVTVDGLETETWIMPDQRSPDTASLVRVCEAAGFTPKVSFQSSSHATILALVSAGLGVAMLPALACTRTPGVVMKRVESPHARREVYVVRSPALTDGPWRQMTHSLQTTCHTLASHSPGVHTTDDT